MSRLGQVLAPEAPTSPPVLALRLAGLSLNGRPILGPIALDIAAGETVALCGPSGVGKSTLLRVILGLLPAPGGQVTRPDRIGIVFQDPTLLPWRSARQNLTLTTGVDPAAADRALAEVGLAGLGDLTPGALSLGQQRRLALARAFASAPELLLMDEPFVSLDPETADAMLTLFETLRADRAPASLIVTHSEAEAARLADRLVRLGGAPAEIVEARRLRP